MPKRKAPTLSLELRGAQMKNWEQAKIAGTINHLTQAKENLKRLQCIGTNDIAYEDLKILHAAIAVLRSQATIFKDMKSLDAYYFFTNQPNPNPNQQQDLLK